MDAAAFFFFKLYALIVFSAEITLEGVYEMLENDYILDVQVFLMKVFFLNFAQVYQHCIFPGKAKNL